MKLVVGMLVSLQVQRLQVQGQESSRNHTCFSRLVQVCSCVHLWSLVVVVAEEGEGVVGREGSDWVLGDVLVLRVLVVECME